MNILLVYPKYPDSFWSFTHALRFISKKAAVPPLGLITVSAMLPGTWQKRLVDMNVNSLKTSDLAWADYVFISAMHIQKDSVTEVVAECVKQQVKIIAGGPLFTQEYVAYPEIDHFILNEAEITLPLFLKDLEKGITPERVYKTSEFADLTKCPTPDYQLLKRKEYAFMNIQVSRGCPFACDFCEITSLLGHKVRMKSTQQIINELEKLNSLNWRGSVFVVDDNFIGNKNVIKNDLLPTMITWMKEHKYPFTFNTQTSINLADDKELMEMMINAGFSSTFIGIETLEEVSLQGCNKVQNNNRDLLQSVKAIQQAGLQVSAGFIVGFDDDTSSVFQRQTGGEAGAQHGHDRVPRPGDVVDLARLRRDPHRRRGARQQQHPRLAQRHEQRVDPQRGEQLLRDPLHVAVAARVAPRGAGRLEQVRREDRGRLVNREVARLRIDDDRHALRPRRLQQRREQFRHQKPFGVVGDDQRVGAVQSRERRAEGAGRGLARVT